VHLVAAEKGIAIETVLGNPADPDPEFLVASPFRKIPALVDGDFSLADSTAIVTYFDALQPEPSITPGDAKARAKAIWYEEFADTIMTPAGGKVVFNRFVAPKVMGRPGDEEAAKQGEIELKPILDWFESVVPADGWLTGHFSIGDIAVASTFRTLGYVDLEPGPSHPKTLAWYGRVTKRSSWQAVAAQEAAILARFGS
jgi:glutathione S-transferase